jgi:hypothetical protein
MSYGLLSGMNGHALARITEAGLRAVLLKLSQK